MNLDRQQLMALRVLVALGEHTIRGMHRGPNRLGWTRKLRKAKSAIRHLTHAYFEKIAKEGSRVV